MQITILTYGSRGDVQPFLALALSLQKSGHTVKLAAPHRFEGFVSAYNIPFTPLAGDPEIISQRLNDAGANPIGMVRSIKDYIFEIAPKVSRSAYAACEGADILIHSFLFTVGGHSWAYDHGIPDISVQTFPMFAPTRAFPNLAVPHTPPGLVSYFSHWIASQIFWYGGNSGYGPARRANPDIPYPNKLFWPFTDSSQHHRTPILFAYSSSILPRPDDWRSDIHVIGYFFINTPDTYQPPVALADFLASGRPPVCVTFGSMIHRDAERIYCTIFDALERTRNRAIVLSGWSSLSLSGGVQLLPEQSADILVMDAIPHDWLLPHCKAVIHHGGAGTTAAGLRSGIPNLVVPFAADQPFWGTRVQALGAGPQPIPVKKLTTEKLVAALDEVDGDALRSGAQAVGRKIRAEDGVGTAVNFIEKYAAKWHKSHPPHIF